MEIREDAFILKKHTEDVSQEENDEADSVSKNGDPQEDAQHRVSEEAANEAEQEHAEVPIAHDERKTPPIQEPMDSLQDTTAVELEAAVDAAPEPAMEHDGELEQALGLTSKPSENKNAAQSSPGSLAQTSPRRFSPQASKRKSTAPPSPDNHVDHSDEEVEHMPDLRTAQPPIPHIDDYLPYPFPHKIGGRDPPLPPNPRRVTVMEWIREQQTYLLDTMRERMDQRLASVRQRNLQERKRLEKKLRSQ